MKNEIVFYQHNELAGHIEVRLEDETVWLTQAQMALLFSQTKQNISLHINNCFREKELSKASTVKEYLTVQIEGQRKINRKLEYYNLDVIISVGYRVKSKQGTQFRIWASRILKDYLLKGYAINNRMNRLEDNFEALKNKVDQIDLHINTHDRFLLIDQKELYHLGASLKDLGKKWFAFSKMDENIVYLIINQICKETKV